MCLPRDLADLSRRVAASRLHALGPLVRFGPGDLGYSMRPTCRCCSWPGVISVIGVSSCAIAGSTEGRAALLYNLHQ